LLRDGAAEMTKWADFLIVRVRFNATDTHINQVEYREDMDESIGPARQATRSTIVDSIKNGTTFVTAPPDPSNPSKVDRGASVRVVVIDREEFLRTDSDRIKRDNLDNLPRF
jgi:hypothetical protein